MNKIGCRISPTLTYVDLVKVSSSVNLNITCLMLIVCMFLCVCVCSLNVLVRVAIRKAPLTSSRHKKLEADRRPVHKKRGTDA